MNVSPFSIQNVSHLTGQKKKKIIFADKKPELLNNDTLETPEYKYRLDKFNDTSTGEVKYKLNKIPPEEPVIDIKQYPEKINVGHKLEKIIHEDGSVKYRLNKIIDSIPIMETKQNEEESEKKSPIQETIHQDIKYKLDKIINEDGSIRYKLNKIEQDKKCEKIMENDDEDTTITEKNYDSLENQQFVISQKFFLEKPPINTTILLGSNEKIEKRLMLKDVLENSVYLNSMNFLNYINVRIVSNNDHSIHCKFSLYYLSIDDKQLKKIGEFNIGEIKKKSGKVYTKLLSCNTPKVGCFLISTFEVHSNQPLNEVLYIDYDIYTTKKKIQKEKDVNINDMNRMVDYVQ